MNYSKQEHNRALDRVLADMAAMPTRACIKCGTQTTGSVWADKQICGSLCQRCKNLADEQALRTLEATQRAWNWLTGGGWARPKPNLAPSKSCPRCNGHMTFSPAESDYGEHTGFNRIKTPALWACSNPDCEHQENDE